MDKAVALLSGGIDSPVAIHLMQDRLDIIAVHFHQQPLSGQKEVDKVKELCALLSVPQVYLVPFVEVLKQLVEKCTRKNYFILQKILMFKAAATIAEREGANYLITGENIGQVSSQTLSNLITISKHVPLEILRPLLTYDKEEIVRKAKEIGTYEISKGPEICCLLGPKHPATRSKPEEVGKELEKLPLPTLLQESLEKAEVLKSEAFETPKGSPSSILER